MWLNLGWTLGIWSVGWVIGRGLASALWGMSWHRDRPVRTTKPTYGLHAYQQFVRDLGEASDLVLDLSPNTPVERDGTTYEMIILYVRNIGMTCPVVNLLKRNYRLVAYYDQTNGWHCTAVYTEDAHTAEHSKLIVSLLMNRLRNRTTV